MGCYYKIGYEGLGGDLYLYFKFGIKFTFEIKIRFTVRHVVKKVTPGVSG